MFKLDLEIGGEIRGPKGIKRLPWVKANCLLKQFMQALKVQLSTEAETMALVAGGTASIGANAYMFRANAGGTITNYGIVVGTGTDAVTMTDTKLQTQVTTNIAHGITSFLLENPDAATWRAAITRTITNNTGVTLNITEVGLYVATNAAPGTNVVCADRTLYSVSIPNGEVLALTYRITITL